MIIDAPKREDIPMLRALWYEAFADDDKFIDIFMNTAFSPDRSRCVKEEGKVVAALYWFDCEYCGGRVAYLYAIATAKDYRGRGICSALIKNTHSHLKKLGYTGTVLVPSSPELFGFYKKFGYELSCFVREFSVSASSEGADIRRISKEEYTGLRRQFLPDGSVIQEGENLDFLNSQAEFYTGDGFLLAARREGRKLLGLELLGKTDAASKIVGSLGLESGKFRSPGKDKPFAMVLSFGKEKYAPPSYFGFAFD